MNDKKIKEAIQQYIETKADNMLSETEERHDLSSLDEKVYATLGAKQDKRKTFVLIIGLSITAVWILNKEPVQIAYDTNYSITISYENEQYGYYSNRYVIDKYGVEDISDLKQNPDLFTGSLTDSDIIHLDSVIDKESIIGAKIYPYSDDVLILQNNGRFYYFEKIETK